MWSIFPERLYKTNQNLAANVKTLPGHVTLKNTHSASLVPEAHQNRVHVTNVLRLEYDRGN